MSKFLKGCGETKLNRILDAIQGIIAIVVAVLIVWYGIHSNLGG